MPMVMRRHVQGEQTIIAAADSDVLGKKHTEGALTLDLEKFRPFYEGEKTTPAALKAALASCDSANLAGKECVDAAISSGLVGKGSVLRVGGVPHLQIYRIPKN